MHPQRSTYIIFSFSVTHTHTLSLFQFYLLIRSQPAYRTFHILSSIFVFWRRRSFIWFISPDRFYKSDFIPIEFKSF